MIDVDLPGLGAILSTSSLDAICLVHPPNLRHQCGFTGTDGALVVSAEKRWFLTDSRYTTQAREQVRQAEVREYRQKIDGVVDLLAVQGFKRVGFESEIVSVAQLQRLKEKSPEDLEWVPLGRELTALRGVKSEAESRILKQAADLSAAAFADVLSLIEPGRSEVEIALELEFALRRRGGEDRSFDFIVASGERGALPHGVASDKILAPGELVTIDFGTRFKGYCSDETVTIALGSVSPELRRLFDTVLEAHDRAIDGVRPGVPLKAIDALARDLISERGYGDYFGHGLGHGVGLEIHEFPTVSARSEGEVREGMVFTIEPGIYVPGLGGCRIEDMVLVTGDGCERLTSIPKQFTAI